MHRSPYVSLRHISFVLAALATLALMSGFPVSNANPSQEKFPNPNPSQEKPPMNVKRITPVLLVKEIEPVVPFWVDRLGFVKTVEVPDGNKLGFAAFQKGAAEVMYQTYASVEKDAPKEVSETARKGPTYLHGSRQPGRCARRHERRENRHARSNRLLRHARIQRAGSRRPLHHFCATRRGAATLARGAKPNQTRPSTVAQYLSSYH